jgi:hypothetical protein
MEPDRLFSFVIGNGWTKTWSAGDRALFESVIATEQGGVNFSGFKSNSDFVIEFRGGRFAVGQRTVSKLGRIPTVSMDRSRVGTDFYKTLFAAALIQSVKVSGPISAVFTMPLAWYEDRERVKGLMEGEYEVVFNRKKYTYTLDKHDIRIIPEGFGVLALQYLDEQGCTVNRNIMKASVGVVEIGTGTTDFSFFKALEIQPNKSVGKPVGLSEVWRGVAADILKSPTKREFTLHDIDEIIRQGAYKHKGIPQDVTQFVKRHMPGLATAISGDINDMWEGGSLADAIYFAGGGAAQTKSYFSYDHQQFVDSGHTADAEGAYRYGLFRMRQNANVRK